MSSWFDDFRDIYAVWWGELSARFDGDPDFEACREDALTPVADIASIEQAFGALPTDLRKFLTEVGCGDFYFPIPDEDWADELRVFNLAEALERVESIRLQAQQEMELLDEHGCMCNAHDDEADCREVLNAVLANPKRFFPLLGPENVFDFVYVVTAEPQKGHVSHWYHDYPVCELLDGSYDFDNLKQYGAEFVHLARSGEGHPI